MPTSHALVWLDHGHAKVMRIGGETNLVTQVHDEKHDTRQHNSGVRDVVPEIGLCLTTARHHDLFKSHQRVAHGAEEFMLRPTPRSSP
jgi:hypothetical protein